MIDYDDIRKFTHGPGRVLLPTPGNEVEWWKEQGVDHAALKRFCEEQGLDNLTTVLPQVLLENYGVVAEVEGQAMVGAPIEALPIIITSLSAMSMEVGFLLGWLSFQQGMGKPTVPEL